MRAFTTGRLAKHFDCAPRTVSKWIDSGRLKGYRLPGSQDRRVPAESVRAFCAEVGLPLPPELTKTRRVAYAVSGDAPGFEATDGLGLGMALADGDAATVLVGDSLGLACAEGVARTVRNRCPGVTVLLLVDPANAGHVAPAGLFDAVAVVGSAEAAELVRTGA